MDSESSEESNPPEVKPVVRMAAMPDDYMLQMTAMMVLANLFNSSMGRNLDQSARTAMCAAYALVREWHKHTAKGIT